MKKCIFMGLFLCLATGFAADLPIPRGTKIMIKSDATSGSDYLCVAANENQEMIVKNCNGDDESQQWVFLGMPNSSPYGGFNFVLINLSYKTPKIATCDKFPRLIDFNEGTELGSKQYRLQSNKAINCASDEGHPLTIEGADGWKEGSRLQFWDWNNVINQHWNISPSK